ncbi:beta-lactamase [Legionella geestiana]|uniref:Beta-lactamase n=1 Tax=Legionella geestiana TaxID=45065 RepID=A0A0W0TUJ1_9GAMM|nr:serine hydrolase [Legionella geestiana]KTC99034.1 beta-lactamase [Legionella geestiana]QBS12634.1 DUF302 domain-containing protein [Legionella geestiana]QDQ39648.1 serine hydrolase [Legionella geestiana]STX54906.1 beta-lactamase [Legionella geestiana]
MKSRGFRTLVLATMGIWGGMMPTTLYSATGRGDFHTVWQNQSVDNLIISYMEEHQIPGLSLAIVQAPYITRVVGYGLADTDSKRLVATNTVFNIGQLTNAYTAIAVMQLKEAGKIDLDTPFADYLRDFDIPQQWRQITIRDLMTHTSGLPDYSSDKDFDFSREYTPAEIIDLIKDKALLFPAGTEARQSATDFYLLGLVIEKTSGMSYQDYVTKNQFERAGLKNTFFISNKNRIQNEMLNGTSPFKHSAFLNNAVMINPTEPATGYSQSGAGLIRVAPLSWSATFADSGIMASSSDISTWDIALAGNILLKEPESKAFLYHPITLKNGRVVPGNSGWFFNGHKGMMQIKGNVPGYSAFLSRFTAADELVCVTLLTNKGDLPDLDILGRKIAGAFNEKLGPATGAAWSEALESPYSAEETINRVEAIIKEQGGRVFARINQSAEAAKAGKTLQSTQVLIAGNPAVGTALIEAKPAISLDLPLRLMATTDSNGVTWLSFTDPEALAKAYHLDDENLQPLLKKMRTALLKTCEKAVSP